MMMVAILLANTGLVKGVDCNPSFLDPCVPAFKDPKAQVSDACCDNLEEKKPCICVWYKDPETSNYFKMPGANHVSTSCGVEFPYPKTCD
ncbi:hypothetical protein QVD17_10147 [Tagetes erecta]|uniref:Bifunctional inhibitor/plant lipid transfer protein/seed storage helical domain-containing protein n=1 Tax=Tagetes erecta TaxID=13708 RepID=A0AAD8L571_TARER|nr:hypothetical protein QVD17_10147 [Tagetes erecta]